MHTRSIAKLLIAATAIINGAVLTGCGGGSRPVPTAALTKTYKQTNLVSDLSGLAVTVDPNLVNPWGIAATPTSPFWINDNGTGLSSLYNGAGAKVTSAFSVPPPASSPGPSAPSGIVANTTADFMVAGKSSSFIFATEDGTVSAFANGVVTLEVDNSQIPSANAGAVYKGIAIQQDSTSGKNLLFVTNFRSGFVEVYDTTFTKTTQFTDTTLPAGFAPFGIISANGGLMVSFAKQDAVKHDDADGPGNGYVDLFNTNGALIRHIASQGTLNSPWGMTFAPTSFGPALLVANFGNGRINAYDPNQFTFLGQLKDSSGAPISIEGLWGLSFGNGAAAGPMGTLYFTAGIGNGGTDPATRENHGLFGTITPN